MAISKRMLGILIAAVSACALCLVLGACSNAPASKEASFVGKWTMCEVSQGGQSITYEAADAEMKEQMDKTYFDIKNDGTIEVSDMGSVESGTWEASSATEAKASAGDVNLTMKIEGDKLVATSDASETVVTLRKA